MHLTNKKTLQAALTLAGLSPTKKLGQHFLIDQVALEQIIAAAKLETGDTVLEIGPGVGTLTIELAKRVKKVLAIEKDAKFVDILRRQIPQAEIVEIDFLDFDLSQLPPYKVVANLPYYITSKIIRNLLTSKNKPVSITVLIQKEVAQRITAAPGQMSVLAFSVQYYGQPKTICDVPRFSFWPAPDVDSAVLQIDVWPQPAFAAEQNKLFRLVKAGFGEKRKQLKNALAGGLAINTATAAELIKSAGLPANARAQELDLTDWQKLYTAALKAKVI